MQSWNSRDNTYFACIIYFSQPGHRKILPHPKGTDFVLHFRSIGKRAMSQQLQTGFHTEHLLDAFQRPRVTRRSVSRKEKVFCKDSGWMKSSSIWQNRGKEKTFKMVSRVSSLLFLNCPFYQMVDPILLFTGRVIFYLALVFPQGFLLHPINPEDFRKIFFFLHLTQLDMEGSFETNGRLLLCQGARSYS